MSAIFNTTFYVERQISDRFLSWLKLTYIPEALSSGMYVGAMLMRLSETPDPAAEAYALHLRTDDVAGGRKWIETQGCDLLGHLASELEPERVLYFTTPMEEIEI